MSLSEHVSCRCRLPCRVSAYYMWQEGSLVQATLCALPALYLVDTPEGMDVANVSNKAFPIVRSIMPAAQLADPHAEHPARTEAAMQQVSLCRLLWIAPARRCP